MIFALTYALPVNNIEEANGLLAHSHHGFPWGQGKFSESDSSAASKVFSLPSSASNDSDPTTIPVPLPTGDANKKGFLPWPPSRDPDQSEEHIQ